MQTHLYMVLVSPKEGREEEWLEWHAKQHSLDMLDIDGIRNCQRFVRAEAQLRNDPPWRFMAIYEIETEDLEGVFNQIKERFGTSLMPTTDASDSEKTVSIAWMPLTAPISGIIGTNLSGQEGASIVS